MNEPRPDWLEAELRDLPRDLAPARDLWPGIAARIDSAARGPGRLARALVASLLVCSVAVLFAWQAMQASRVERSPFVLADLAASYADARHRYESAWPSIRVRLDPATAAVIDGNLEVIRVALAEIDAALRESPDDASLRGLLRTTLDAELDLYRRAERLTPTPA